MNWALETATADTTGNVSPDSGSAHCCVNILVVADVAAAFGTGSGSAAGFDADAEPGE
eukprot:CAMPEP_0172662574 /NCGR_PEP_ID=MMETSP1074-20121228/5438_1 /TAXON_ID=2916 /ORGANISM="Ceratium fusus, Strain PA161109" /LENGTH=57 /DNA_ID=CAMNT_0013478499 /DNA_START=670 /DNA_END=844 /DNA_ORIENTATION=-